MSLVAVATVFRAESTMFTVAPDIPKPVESTTKQVMGSGVILVRRLSIGLCTSLKSTVTGLNAKATIVHDVAMCLPLCACACFLKAVRTLMAVWMLLALMAACASESLLVSAFATPALSMQPAFRKSPITLMMLEASVIGAKLTIASSVLTPLVPPPMVQQSVVNAYVISAQSF